MDKFNLVQLVFLGRTISNSKIGNRYIFYTVNISKLGRLAGRNKYKHEKYKFI